MALVKLSPLLAACVAGCSALTSAPGITSADDLTIELPGVELRYTSHATDRAFRAHYSRDTWDGLYGSVWIRAQGNSPRKIEADPDDGYFVASQSPPVSPTGAYVVLVQLSGGTVTHGESSEWHEVASCVFVDTASARILALETGEICGGEFIDDTTWAWGSERSLDLARLAK